MNNYFSGKIRFSQRVDINNTFRFNWFYSIMVGGRGQNLTFSPSSHKWLWPITFKLPLTRFIDLFRQQKRKKNKHGDSWPHVFFFYLLSLSFSLTHSSDEWIPTRKKTRCMKERCHTLMCCPFMRILREGISNFRSVDCDEGNLIIKRRDKREYTEENYGEQKKKAGVGGRRHSWQIQQPPPYGKRLLVVSKACYYYQISQMGTITATHPLSVCRRRFGRWHQNVTILLCEVQEVGQAGSKFRCFGLW